MANPQTKFIFVKNGFVSAIVFPGEPVNNTYGEAAGEVPFDTAIGVGDKYPADGDAKPVKTPKKAAAKTDAAATEASTDATAA
jgi:hypothetical protein